MKRPLKVLAQIVLAVYFWPMLFFVPYYNWTYAREHGFGRWLLLGELAATGKALVWPYFALTDGAKASWTDQQRENARHIVKSFDARQAATKLANQGPPYSSVPPAETQERQRLYHVALDEARQVTDEVLEKVLPGLGKPFREKYQRSIELQLQAIDQANVAAEIAGSQLHDEWVDWINPRLRQLRIPKHR